MKSFIIGVLLFPLASFSQKLKVNAYDKYKKAWRMETFPVTIKADEETKMDISLVAIDTSLFLQVAGSGIGTNTLDTESQMVFLLDNDSTATARSIAIQSFDYSRLPLFYRHEYAISLDNLEILTRNNLQALRKYSVGGFDDIYIEKKNAGKVKEISALFMTELKKGKLLPEKSLLLPAAFPGGKAALLKFLNRNIKPVSELQVGEKKNAVVQFLVTADGTVLNLEMKQSAGPSFDNELLRMLNRMPKWKPALEKGKGVDFMVIQPITFYRTETLFEIQF